jgi:hypothetical protein
VGYTPALFIGAIYVRKKVKITEKAFTDFTGVMFRTSFTKSVSDHPVNERMQNRITAAMRAVPMEPTVAVTGVSVSPKSASVEVKKRFNSRLPWRLLVLPTRKLPGRRKMLNLQRLTRLLVS